MPPAASWRADSPRAAGRSCFSRQGRIWAHASVRRCSTAGGIPQESAWGYRLGLWYPSPVPTAALRSSGAASSWGTSWLTRFAVRGHPADFDGWAKRGNPGWSFGDVLPAFRRLEADADFGDAPWHVDEARLGEGVSIETVGGPLGTTSVDAPGRQRRENSPSERTSTPRRSPPKPQRMTEPIWWGRQTGAQRWGVRFAKQTLCQLCAQIPVSAPLRRWPFPAIEFGAPAASACSPDRPECRRRGVSRDNGCTAPNPCERACVTLAATLLAGGPAAASWSSRRRRDTASPDPFPVGPRNRP